MNVSEVMSKPAVTVAVNARIDEIANVLISRDISGVPVLNHAGHLVGIVTEADLVGDGRRGRRRSARLRAALARHLRERADGGAEGDRTEPDDDRPAFANDVMSHPVDTATPDERVRVVAARMLRHGHKRLPVVDHDVVVGVVSRHDLLQALVRDDAALRAEVQRVLDAYALVMPLWDATATVEHGKATIAGSVTYTHHARDIEAAVATIEGIRGVDNHIASKFSEFTQRHSAPLT